MTSSPPGGRAARAGFTLVEMMVAAAALMVVLYTLANAVGLGSRSQRTVMRVATESDTLRRAVASLSSELKLTSDSLITVTTLADANHELGLSLPIEVGGSPAWGVPVHTFGVGTQGMPDWSLCYTVQGVPAGGGEVNRRLLRRILDETGAIQDEEVICEGLRSGSDAPPGFTVVRSGDLWEVTLTTAGYTTNADGRGAVFHVRTRN